MNGLLLLETAAVEQFKRMHPSRMYLSTTAPKTGTDIKLPKQAAILLAAFQGMV